MGGLAAAGGAAGVGRALGRGGRGGERAGAVRAAAVGGGRVVGPGVGVDQGGAVRCEQPCGVGAAQAERRLDVQREEGARSQRGVLGDLVGVGVVVVLDDPLGDVDRGGPGVDELDPVTGAAAARLDLVDPHRRLLLRRGRRTGQADGQDGQGDGDDVGFSTPVRTQRPVLVSSGGQASAPALPAKRGAQRQPRAERAANSAGSS